MACGSNDWCNVKPHYASVLSISSKLGGQHCCALQVDIDKLEGQFGDADAEEANDAP